jgi:hypothetical protein
MMKTVYLWTRAPYRVNRRYINGINRTCAGALINLQRHALLGEVTPPGMRSTKLPR